MEHRDTETLSFDISNEEILELNKLSQLIIGCAMEVHKELGPGLMESAYEECLFEELRLHNLEVETQVELPLYYKGRKTTKTYRIDMLVERKILLELKAVEELKPVHEVQLLTYLKLTRLKLGLLINFNVPVLKKGIKRKINGKIEYTGIQLQR